MRYFKKIIPKQFIHAIIWITQTKNTPWVDARLCCDSWPCQGATSGQYEPLAPNSLGLSSTWMMGQHSWNIWSCVTKTMHDMGAKSSREAIIHATHTKNKKRTRKSKESLQKLWSCEPAKSPRTTKKSMQSSSKVTKKWLSGSPPKRLKSEPISDWESHSWVTFRGRKSLLGLLLSHLGRP